MEITEETRNKIYVDYCEKNRNTVIYGFRSARYLHFKAGMNAAVNYILSQSLAQGSLGQKRVRYRNFSMLQKEVQQSIAVVIRMLSREYSEKKY